MRIDGRETIVENLADNGGVRIAYHAFQRRLLAAAATNDDDDADALALRAKIRGLERFSNAQLFFIAYGFVSWGTRLIPSLRQIFCLVQK